MEDAVFLFLMLFTGMLSSAVWAIRPGGKIFAVRTLLLFEKHIPPSPLHLADNLACQWSCVPCPYTARLLCFIDC